LISLLAPLFLAGLACLAIPVLVHLTRQERGKPTAFPSLMFLERIPFQETARRRLRHLVLLMLRLAALALVVIAFARPFVRGGPLAAVGGPGPEELVVLLDRSYSMDLADQWDQAVSIARSAIGGAGPADRLSLIAFSERPAVLHRSVTDPGRLAAALDTLKPGSLGTRIAPAVKLAVVIGVPDQRLLEVAAAFIELKPGASASEKDIIDYCKGRIASFKAPRHVRFVTAWPMSSTKVQKFKLREWFDAPAPIARDEDNAPT